MSLLFAASSNMALISFCVYLLAVVFLAWLSSKIKSRSSFVNEYFLGGKTLGVWAFSLTFAATSASGGSFVGFPALIYTHGWILGLWIAGYMLVPLVAMGLLGKRLNEVGRQADAVTIPEILSKRFNSPVIGIMASLMIVVFMFVFLLAQFKAGSKILSSLLSGVDVYHSAVVMMSNATSSIPYLASAEPDYLLCLFVFSFAVIGYVVYGGFRAVVWTDVMQGIVMFFGVFVLLFLTIYQVGGLGNATKTLAKRTPPIFARGELLFSNGADNNSSGQAETLEKGSWLLSESEDAIVRLQKRINLSAQSGGTILVDVLKLTNQDEIESMRNEAVPDVRVRITKERTYTVGHNQPGVYVYAPGPLPPEAESNEDKSSDQVKPQKIGFLGLGAALSFFAFWTFSGAGQPSNMVRLMAFKNTQTLKRSIVTVSLYYSFIYFSLVIIFCCARILLPGMEIDADRIMPEMAIRTTSSAGIPWLAGLLLAAPFAAVMSSVDSFLLLVSSSIVRDVYQRIINPHANERKTKAVTYIGTFAIGILATIGAIHPPTYLQDLIIFASGGLSATFLVPVLFSLYWPRMTSWGAIAAMIGGFAGHFWVTKSSVGQMLVDRTGLEPFIWDVLISFCCLVLVTYVTKPPDKDLLDRYF